MPGITAVQPNYTVQVATTTPNDPYFSLQYDMGGASSNGINAVSAWDATTGSTKTTVAVVDSGIDYTHPDLYLNVALNQGEIPPTIHGLSKSSLVDTDGDGIIDFHDLNSLNAQGVPVGVNGVATPGLALSQRINAAFTTDSNGNGYIDAGDLLADPSGTTESITTTTATRATWSAGTSSPTPTTRWTTTATARTSPERSVLRGMTGSALPG